MKVLLALDGSRSSTRARDLVANVRWPAATYIEVLYVDQLTEEDLRLPAAQYAAIHDRAQRLAERRLASLARRLQASGRTVEPRIALGRPASVIIAEAKRVGADLVVLGSRGYGGLASALLGSVAAEVVDHASCPVLVARTPRLTRAVLAADGSAGSRHAERLLTRWPFLAALPVRVVSVATLLAPLGGAEGAPIDAATWQRLIDDEERDHERIAGGAAKRLVAAKVKATAEVRLGSPAPELIATAAATGADLIVVGSRGQTGLRRLVLGSVARSVLFHARTSVLITREKPRAKR